MRTPWRLVVAGVLAVSCAGASQTPKESSPAPDGAAADTRREAPQLLAEVNAPVVDGNSVEIVNNGKVFDALVEEIGHARKSVNILLFIWRASGPSDRVVKALIAKANEHLECRVALDPLASPDFNEQVRPMLETAGCEVRYFKPIQQTIAQGKEAVERMHRKIVVIDGETGITGGFGIWKSWEGDGLTKDNWRDTNAVVRGPVVAELQRAFEKTWTRLEGAPLPASAYPKLKPQGKIRAAFVASDAIQAETSPDGKTCGERTAEMLIAQAKKRLCISNSYFVPTDKMLRMLQEKAKSGVDVRVLAPGPVHDWRTVRNAQREGYSRLIRAGVRVYEYQPSMMHSKVFLVDDSLVSLGSMNLDPLSLKQLEEGQLVLWDEAVAKQVEKDLINDFARSEQRNDKFPGPLEVASRGLLWFIGRW